MELRQLRYFAVLAEELHFGRAAERLHMAQSPLSQQIIQLERELGVVLVERGRRITGLTDAGELFLRSVRSILADLDEAVASARRASRGETGTICVGYVAELTADLLPLSLKAFKDVCPEVEVELIQGVTGELLAGLRDRSIDVAFVRSPGLMDDLVYEQLVEESLVLASPEHYGLPERTDRLADLAGEAFVLPSPSGAPGLRRDIEGACASHRFEPTVAREANSVTAILLLVAAGAGLGLIPASIAHSYPVPGVVYTKFVDPPRTNAGMAWRSREASAIANRLLETTRRVAADHQHQPDVWPERRVHDPAVDGEPA
ncbi:MAG TPA: LysR substrate-binding domain-containing protein [Acidimicrobiales bacterium]|nr:LysR substrate-binding domain-containing protein [Acidimicrobiales bacterium]